MWWMVAAALAGECEVVGFGEVVDVESPSVLVLGERHGMQPDMNRALKVTRRFAREGEVTLALEAVHHRFQGVLDGYARREVQPEELPTMLDWESSWGFPWAAYAPLVRASEDGAVVVAAGLDLGPRPEEQSVPLPPSYMDLLRPAMAGHPLPPGEEGRFVQAMAWRDFRIAQLALEGWDGKGRLVVVTGRGHVEGGKGVAWQLQRMTSVPVHAAVLARSGEPPCYAGDRLWAWP
jgi:uncharacterized iron-regulated protein